MSEAATGCGTAEAPAASHLQLRVSLEELRPQGPRSGAWGDAPVAKAAQWHLGLGASVGR